MNDFRQKYQKQIGIVGMFLFTLLVLAVIVGLLLVG